MARLNLSIEKQTGQKNENLGKLILFCEGHTEKNYFNYFATIIKDNPNKYSHIKIELIPAEGNAKRVLNFANEYLSDDNNAKTYSLYEKYLIFDCDAPLEITQVILEMRRSNAYILLPTNLLFETWLLMHFEEVGSRLKKAETYKRLEEALGISNYDAEKASEGIIRKIIDNGDSVKMAISNAKRLEQMYKNKNFMIEKDIENMNPFTAVHTLVEHILGEMQRVKS
jgi:hypothetical protein